MTGAAAVSRNIRCIDAWAIEGQGAASVPSACRRVIVDQPGADSLHFVGVDRCTYPGISAERQSIVLAKAQSYTTFNKFHDI
jgi:hypothetical protein